MRNAVLAILALSAAITTQAKADYVWEFVPTQVSALTLDGGGAVTYSPTPGVSSAEAASWLPAIRLEITDAAFSSQSLSLNWSNCQGLDAVCQSGPTGDFSKIVSICDFCGISPDPTRLFGWGDIELSWNKRGLLSGEIFLEGDVDDLTLDIGAPDNGASGFFASDASQCGMGPAQRCDVQGNMVFQGEPAADTSLPEPASFALLAVGLLGAGATRNLV